MKDTYDYDYERKNRIDEALALRGIRQAELCDITGISKTAVNNWIKQRWQPRQTALYKMAKVLDVSEMWLAGYDCPMERPVSEKKLDAFTNVVDLLRNNDRYYNLVDSILALDADNYLLIETMVKQLNKKDK